MVKVEVTKCDGCGKTKTGGSVVMESFLINTVAWDLCGDCLKQIHRRLDDWLDACLK